MRALKRSPALSWSKLSPSSWHCSSRERRPDRLATQNGSIPLEVTRFALEENAFASEAGGQGTLAGQCACVPDRPTFEEHAPASEVHRLGTLVGRRASVPDRSTFEEDAPASEAHRQRTLLDRSACVTDGPTFEEHASPSEDGPRRGCRRLCVLCGLCVSNLSLAPLATRCGEWGDAEATEDAERSAP